MNATNAPTKGNGFSLRLGAKEIVGFVTLMAIVGPGLIWTGTLTNRVNVLERHPTLGGHHEMEKRMAAVETIIEVQATQLSRINDKLDALLRRVPAQGETRGRGD